MDFAARNTTNEIPSETTLPMQEELQGGGPREGQWQITLGLIPPAFAQEEEDWKGIKFSEWDTELTTQKMSKYSLSLRNHNFSQKAQGALPQVPCKFTSKPN